MRPRAVVSWSSGKDSAYALHRVREAGELEVIGLLTTTSLAPAVEGQISEPVERVAMHGVRRSLLERQASALGLPLVPVELPWPCPNEVYEARMGAAVERLRGEGVEVIVFGDLFLEDIRAYREQKLAGTGLRPVFPLWGSDTRVLAGEMLAAGLVARLTCVDLRVLGREFVGRVWDESLLAELPEQVDPCGERGEFHTFVSGGPGFSRAIDVQIGERLERDGFAWADLTEQ